MMKQVLVRAVDRLPAPLRNPIRDSYWRVKSKLLYQRLFSMLGLESRLHSGITVKIGSQGEWWAYNDIFVNHEYDPAILAALASRPQNRPLVVLDLGANVGYFLLRLADLILQNPGGPIFCDATLVEGSPTNFKTLETRVARQNLKGFQCRLVHGLVGARTGRAVIFESALHVKNTIMDDRPSGGASVAFVDLGEVMAEKETIDLLKCDIEGAEESFIENYPDLLSRVNNAVFEMHHQMCDTAKSVRRLSEFGFRQTELYRNDAISICMFSKDH